MIRSSSRPISVSILALREKGDPGYHTERRIDILFQSSPFVRRATGSSMYSRQWMAFQSSPFVRRATARATQTVCACGSFNPRPS